MPFSASTEAKKTLFKGQTFDFQIEPRLKNK